MLDTDDNQHNPAVSDVDNYSFEPIHSNIQKPAIANIIPQLILSTQNNKSVKAPFTRDVWKIQYSGCGLVQIQHSASPHTVFAT